ncbi:MAG: class I SAM-dependent methyltransferase, partial [Oscillospiraceae bacterium]|nr:class I SAM-dependent methyltransferase [Oscillospiraceae bacterium]
MNTSAANNTLKLSNRLSAAAAMVREGTRVADVGCDHGKLSAWLLLSGRCRFAYAIDISKPSLQKAADLFVSLKLNEVTKTIHDNGLNGVSADEVDDIVIAGLGGDSIMAIIDSTEWLKDNSKHLVLVAASRQALVRRHIYRTGFQITKEQPVLDAGHYYSVMSVEYTGVLLEISNICAELGSIKPY